MIDGAERLELDSGGLGFSAWSMGSGPLVVLLHGFPDTPRTFLHQLPAIAAAGYRAVAVTLRGYESSSQPTNGSYYVADLALDVVGWIDALGGDRAHIVGHDWGATIAFAAAALAPDRVRSLTAIAVPHPRRFGEVLLADTAQLQRLDYIFFFQQAGVAEQAVSADNFRYLEELWRRWSPGWRFERNELSDLRRHFREPGVAQSALTYYRHATDTTSAAGQVSQALFSRPILAPTLGIHGVDDGCIAASAFEKSMREEDFPGGLQVASIQGAGHFVHIEQPEAVNQLLIGHLAKASSRAD
jgi:pimeloyl-ACP methyl ester carboxylesterase